MADGSGTAGARYRAFISYSHRDVAFAARLHRRLEGYVLPRRLGAERRLTPIFKDREELPAAHDLSAQVRAALAVSDCLIVVCSADAAASPWVAREIDLFRDLHPDRPILAALIRGEPGEAFPPALAANGIEPLAADFRKGADGERLALLKLVAGIAGVGVDQLIQRDAQRRLRAVTGVTALALAGMIAMGAVTLFALESRAEANRQRARSEGLAEFMLSDLRYKLKGVGRDDVMDDVNQRVGEIYSAKGADRLDATSTGLRAALLQAMGEDEARRHRLDAARAHFREAEGLTAKLLARRPGDAKRLLAQGQSQYWLGEVSYRKHETIRARKAWESYRSISTQLTEREPGNWFFRRERAFADGNLCSLAVEQERDRARALASCSTALDQMTALLKEKPGDPEQSSHVANRHAWMADAFVLAGDLESARAHRQTEVQMLEDLLKADSRNMLHQERWAAAQRGLATVDARAGQLGVALARLIAARPRLVEMIDFAPGNADLRDQLTKYDITIGNIRKVMAKEQ